MEYSSLTTGAFVAGPRSASISASRRVRLREATILRVGGGRGVGTRGDKDLWWMNACDSCDILKTRVELAMGVDSCRAAIARTARCGGRELVCKVSPEVVSHAVCSMLDLEL